jgi:hypothetical protein
MFPFRGLGAKLMTLQPYIRCHRFDRDLFIRQLEPLCMKCFGLNRGVRLGKGMTLPE